MNTWTRRTRLGGALRDKYEEIWEYSEDGSVLESFPVEVSVGKPLDVMGLKNTSLDETIQYANFLKGNAAALYPPDKARRHIDACPCCAHPASAAAPIFEVYGIDYHSCPACGHVFVRFQPAEEMLHDAFVKMEEYAATYTDMNSLETRMCQVIRPKVKWTMDLFRRHFRCDPSRAVDVGAGGGHFVAGVKEAGVEVQGYELSRASRSFAKNVFGIDLLDSDFLEERKKSGTCDLITFWGLLEYVPEPRRFLAAAREHLGDQGGMLVVEVPRYGCLGTAIQKKFSSTIARHLDPTSHVNCFTDESLATALYTSGFKPVAVWYFGMDVYELLVQISINIGNHDILPHLAHLIPDLQQCLDTGMLCDDIIVAAVPTKTDRERKKLR